jgi:hypothetical protein
VKANHGRERDPVCVFAIDIAAVNQVNVKVVGVKRLTHLGSVIVTAVRPELPHFARSAAV